MKHCVQLPNHTKPDHLTVFVRSSVPALHLNSTYAGCPSLARSDASNLNARRESASGRAALRGSRKRLCVCAFKCQQRDREQIGCKAPPSMPTPCSVPSGSREKCAAPPMHVGHSRDAAAERRASRRKDDHEMSDDQRSGRSVRGTGRGGRLASRSACDQRASSLYSHLGRSLVGQPQGARARVAGCRHGRALSALLRVDQATRLPSSPERCVTWLVERHARSRNKNHDGPTLRLLGFLAVVAFSVASWRDRGLVACGQVGVSQGHPIM